MTLGSLQSPQPIIVDLLAAITPPSTKPIIAMKKPIPPAIAAFKSAGMALMMVSRILKTVKSQKITPATKTPAKAVCHLIPIPITTL